MLQYITYRQKWTKYYYKGRYYKVLIPSLALREVEVWLKIRWYYY